VGARRRRRKKKEIQENISLSYEQVNLFRHIKSKYRHRMSIK
jgi:hypothetical protein